MFPRGKGPKGRPEGPKGAQGPKGGLPGAGAAAAARFQKFRFLETRQRPKSQWLKPFWLKLKLGGGAPLCRLRQLERSPNRYRGGAAEGPRAPAEGPKSEFAADAGRYVSWVACFSNRGHTQAHIANWMRRCEGVFSRFRGIISQFCPAARQRFPQKLQNSENIGNLSKSMKSI